MFGPPTVEIVSAEDKSYSGWIERCIRFEKDIQTHSDKDPLASDYNRKLRSLEAATLRLLGLLFGLQTDHVLKVSRAHPHLRLGPYDFHQLDALSLSGDTVVFCEVKHTFSLREAVRAARRQLRKRISLASLRWKECRGVALCFHLSEQIDALKTYPYGSFERLGEVLASPQPDHDTPSVVVAGTDLRIYLDEHGFNGAALMGEMMESKRLLDDPTASTGAEPTPIRNSFGAAMERFRDGHGR